MKHSRHIFSEGLVASLALVVNTSFADATWQGAQYDLNADWSLATNWNGDVPTGDAVATIAYLESNTGKPCTLGLTPPLDFTGSINVTYDTTSYNTSFHNTLRLNALEGATWSVTGNGMLYADETLAARIASTFTGVIVVTNGASFTVPTALADAVEFVGDGRLVISETKRVPHLSGFTGTLVWAGEAAFAPAETTLVQLRRVELANGASLNYAERTLSANPVFRIKDWNEAPEDWTFGGTSGSHDTLEFDTRLAHPNADGSLALVTDPKQYHTAIYSGYKLKMHDDWGVSFHYEPAMPADSAVGRAGWTSTWSGAFGFFMVPSLEITDMNRYMPAGKVAHGFKTYLYSSAGSSFPYPHLGWFRGQDVFTSARWYQNALDAVGGPNLRKAMDVTMASHDGLITVTLRQGDKYFAMVRSSANVYTARDIPHGFYLTLAAASDWWEASETHHNVPWSKHTISNFRGWYRAREAGRWTADSRSFYPFTTANCAVRRYTAASTYTENAAALEEDGSFKVESNGERLETIIRSSLALDRRKRHLVAYDLVYGDGTKAENTERFKFGFTRSSDGLSSWLYRWDANHNSIAAEKWDNYVYPYFVTLYWYSGTAYFFTTKPTDSSGHADVYSSAKFSYPKMLKNQTAHTSLVYDGGRTLYCQVQSAQHVTDASWAPSATDVDYSTAGNGNNMFFLMSSWNTWGQVDAWLKNLTVKTLADNQAVYLTGDLSVAAGASATFNAEPLVAESATEAATLGQVSLGAGSTLNVTGGKAVIEKVRVSGSGATLAATATTLLGANVAYEGEAPTAGLTVSGSVTLAKDEMTFTIPEGWRHVKAPIPLLTAPEGVLPSAVRILSDAGADITAKGALTIKGGTLSVDFAHGLVILLR